MFISKTSRWMLLSFLLLAVPAMAQENPLSAVTAQTKPPEDLIACVTMSSISRSS